MTNQEQRLPHSGWSGISLISMVNTLSLHKKRRNKLIEGLGLKLSVWAVAIKKQSILIILRLYEN